MDYKTKMMGEMSVGPVGGISATPRPQSPVESALDRQQNILAELHGTINGLEDRIRTILNPPPPQAVEKREQTNPTQLSHLIEQYNLSIEGAIKRLHEIMGRLEL